ncbi:MAG: putative molybdenum carrier protein [Deltaproteobacteria bacterium]|nr:putative molybdenum carrier protein [Deltaproteobacteria bacterium]
MTIRKIVSGGQTGVDRAALDAAKALGLERGGWCPKDRRAEDGRIPDDYSLQETSTADYAERTELNVRDSDGTLILTVGLPSGGTAYTIECARKLRRPYFLVDLAHDPDPSAAGRWLAEGQISVLNVAGPRQSQFAVGYARAYRFLLALFPRKHPDDQPR